MDADDAVGAELFRPQGEGRVVCPAPELVPAARAGVLPEALQAQVLAHVERCSMCRALAGGLDDETVGEMTSDEFEQVLGRIRSADTRESHRPARRVGRWTWHAAAAVVVLVTAGAVLVRQFKSRPVPPGPADQVLRLEPPGGRGGPSVLLRSSRRPGEAEDLSRALEPFRTNDYAEVVRRLRDVLSRHPQSALGHFYLG